MSLVETIKHVFVSEGKAVYQCEDCGETFKVDPDVDDPSCSACGSDEVVVINRV
jgi:DNA-directed RNA polymerase subunit RPC12/RpoP